MSFVVPKLSSHVLSAGLILGLSFAAPLSFANAQAKAPVRLQFPVEPGDVLAVSVANHPEMSSDALVVSEAGRIALPVVGPLTVAGKTMAQVQNMVTAAYKKELLRPAVTVTLVSAKPRAVFFSGSAVKPGSLDLRPGWRISEAISAYGGLPTSADELTASLLRGGQNVRLNLAAVSANPGSAADWLLRAGDTLKIDLPVGRIISINGDVRTPGTHILRRSHRLVDAVIAAGGLIQAPEVSQVTLLRSGKRSVLNLQRAFEVPASPENIELSNGDALIVKGVRTAISVVSFNDLVKSPGTYTLEGQPTVLRALLAAGGTTVPPNQLVATIRRGQQSIPVDLEKAGRDPAFDLALREGDVLLVSPPEGPAVRVSGGVVKPGDLFLQEGGTLLDALVAAGGLAGKPSEVQLSVLRKVGDRSIVLTADPVALISLKDMGQNVRLQSGDLVMVNPRKAPATVYVRGEVKVPGPYQLMETDGVMEALIRAGGPTEFASLRRVQLLRSNQTSLELDASQAGAEARLKTPFEDGDTIVVPRNPNQVQVLNAVQQPGYYPIPENRQLTVGDALLAAGGPRGQIRDVALVRKGANGEIEARKIPVSAVESGNLAINEVLLPGDIIYVPEGRTTRNGLRNTLGAAGALTGILRFFF